MKRNKELIFNEGFCTKIYPFEDRWQGETLNAKDVILLDGKDEEDIKKTLENGLKNYAKSGKEYSVYPGISVQELIAELSLSITDPHMPCYLKDGTPITGVYVSDGALILDTYDLRKIEIKKILSKEG